MKITINLDNLEIDAINSVIKNISNKLRLKQVYQITPDIVKHGKVYTISTTAADSYTSIEIEATINVCCTLTYTAEKTTLRWIEIYEAVKGFIKTAGIAVNGFIDKEIKNLKEEYGDYFIHNKSERAALDFYSELKADGQENFMVVAFEGEHTDDNDDNITISAIRSKKELFKLFTIDEFVDGYPGTAVFVCENSSGIGIKTMTIKDIRQVISTLNTMDAMTVKKEKKDKKQKSTDSDEEVKA